MFEEENRQSPSFHIDHSKQSHSKAVYHKTTTRHHLASTKLMLRAQWDPVCGGPSHSLLQCPESKSGLGHRKTQALFLVDRDLKADVPQERHVWNLAPVTASTHRWAPCGALPHLPGNLETSSPCPFSANRHFSDSKESFHMRAIPSQLRVHSYWKRLKLKTLREM